MRNWAVLPVAGILLASCGAPPPYADAKTSQCESRNYAEQIGGPISLVSQTGEHVTEENFIGSPTIVFFGFTYCPDICPTTLVTLKRAGDMMGQERFPKTVFISVDPERDTAEQLDLYLGNGQFPPNTIGLTGSDAELKQATLNFVAPYSREDQPDSAAGYTMNHTSLIYLMDENWQLQSFFDSADTAESIAACLEVLL